MKKFKKQYFNMVEIVLALMVVAIAIVSLMGMLPVALRASKNSVADNSVAAAVELMKMQVDTQFRTNYAALTTFVSATVEPENGADDVLSYKTDSAAKFPADSELENYAFQITQGTVDGTYKIEFFSGDFSGGAFANTDFDADIRVWREDIDDIYIPNNTIDNPSVASLILGTLPSAYGCTVCIKVSWPSGVKYENQEHRLYKFDYFKR